MAEDFMTPDQIAMQQAYARDGGSGRSVEGGVDGPVAGSVEP